MVLGQRGNATLPFKVENTLGDERGGTVYEVSFSTYCEYRQAMPASGRPSLSSPFYDDYSPYADGQRIHLDGKDGTKFRSRLGDLWLPTKCKLLAVEPAEGDIDTEDDGPCCSSHGGSENPPIRPGSLLDAEFHIMSKTGSVTIKHAGAGVTVNDRTFNERQALIHLVRDHGLRADVSQQLLKTAATKGRLGNAYTFHIKYAQPFTGDPYLTGGGPMAPAVPDPAMTGGNPMGWEGPTMPFTEYNLPVPGMEGNLNRDAYAIGPNSSTNPRDFETIQQAMQTGQKEVFDTAMIGSMLKAVREDTMIDKYIPDLVKGMDRLGRLLFMFYWHMDKFSDRYGKQDLPELEDTLRNAFEIMGDCVLFLKQKTIEPYPEEDSVSLDLADSAS